eukprot:TRINITY_DN81895_c0_g1_i1.p1 TRINITY_DN81895_c0_g1~~TRINITY_DN81895_c0_g1_i1.p1  ORF type:complete len:212 (-),score=54.20 TRINITY_DN81895_c0_g1_i1:169-804(-)
MDHLLALDPPQYLTLRKPTAQNQPPTVTLRLTNRNSGFVAFKVKTTAPKSYLVRPSSGTLKGYASQEVQIIFQTASGDLKASTSHKFLVQAVSVNGADPISSEAWKEFPKDAVREQRLAIIPEDEEAAPPSGAAANPAVAGDSASPDLSKKYEELVQYTLQLEKMTRQKDDELNKLKQKPVKSSGAGFSTVHMLAVALVGALLAIACQRLA